MITLEGIELHGLYWEDELEFTGVSAEVAHTLSGAPIVWEESQPEGRLITLKGTDTSGLLTRGILVNVKALASVPFSVYTLNYHNSAYHVRFRNEESPVIDAEPLVGHEKIQPGEYYKNVVIKLMEV